MRKCDGINIAYVVTFVYGSVHMKWRTESGFWILIGIIYVPNRCTQQDKMHKHFELHRMLKLILFNSKSSMQLCHIFSEKLSAKCTHFILDLSKSTEIHIIFLFETISVLHVQIFCPFFCLFLSPVRQSDFIDKYLGHCRNLFIKFSNKQNILPFNSMPMLMTCVNRFSLY